MQQEVSARLQRGTGGSMRYGNRHLFVSALTGKGFYSFWEEILADLDRLYLLLGASPDEVSVFLRMAGHVLSERGYRVVYCHRPGRRLALEGLVIPRLGAAILDGFCRGLYGIAAHPSPRMIEVDLSRQAHCRDQLPEERQENREAMVILEEAARLWRQISACFPLADDECPPLEVGSRWLAEELLGKPRCLRRFFAGSVTAEGTLDFIDHLTSGCSKRYYLRGAPGRGGPVMLEALFHGLSRHWKIEAYYSFLDLCCPVALIFPEIALAMVDGTSHFAPSSWAGDTIWELEKDRAGFEPAAGIEGMQVKLSGLLKAAGSALSCSWQPAGATGVTREDVEAFVSRFLRESSGSLIYNHQLFDK